MKFFNLYNRPGRVFSPHGEKTRKKYKAVYDEDGSRKLLEVGEIDMWAEIQSYEKECNVLNLIERYKRSGDISLLQRNVGGYGDVSMCPNSFAQLYSAMNMAKSAFDGLTDSMKEYFQSPDGLIAALADVKSLDEFISKIPVTETTTKNEGEVTA